MFTKNVIKFFYICLLILLCILAKSCNGCTKSNTPTAQWRKWQYGVWLQAGVRRKRYETMRARVCVCVSVWGGSHIPKTIPAITPDYRLSYFVSRSSVACLKQRSNENNWLNVAVFRTYTRITQHIKLRNITRSAMSQINLITRNQTERLTLNTIFRWSVRIEFRSNWKYS